jgi:hypothetical protein
LFYRILRLLKQGDEGTQKLLRFFALHLDYLKYQRHPQYYFIWFGFKEVFKKVEKKRMRIKPP